MIKQTLRGHNNIQAGGDVTVNVGISMQEYEERLKRRESEVTERLGEAHDREKSNREAELAVLREKLLDIETAYGLNIAELSKRIKGLEQLNGQVPNQLLEKAKDALIKGDDKAAKKIFEQIDNQSDPVIEVAAESKNQQAGIAVADVRYRDALDLYIRAAQLMPDNATYNAAASTMLRILGEYDKALEYLGRALDINIKDLGEDHLDMAVSYRGLGRIWHEKGDYDKAVEYFEKSLDINIKALGEDHPNIIVARHNLGLSWHEKGEYDKVIEYLELALEGVNESFREDHSLSVAEVYNLLGLAWKGKGEYDKSIPLCQGSCHLN